MIFTRRWLCIFVVIGLFFFVFSISRQPLIISNDQPSVILRIPPGSSVRSIIALLSKKVSIAHPSLCLIWLRVTGMFHQFHYGEYLITNGMHLNTLVDKIYRGDVVVHFFRIAEGARFVDLLSSMQNDTNLNHQFKDVPDLMRRLNASYSSPEGIFFPDTYQYIWPQTDIDVLRQAYGRMQKVAKRAWESRSKNLYYKNVYQALIMASIIEKEASTFEERRKITGVLLRRLNKGMRLQVDPSVAFGIGLKDASKLTRSDLKKRNVYNTYRINGLPPTPIALPSLSSIKASLNPSEGTSYYYVSKGDGSHQFSNTYQEHLDAINRYIRSKKKIGEKKHD